MEMINLLTKQVPDIQLKIESIRLELQKEEPKKLSDKKLRTIFINKIDSITSELLILNELLIDYEACLDEIQREDLINEYYGSNIEKKWKARIT